MSGISPEAFVSKWGGGVRLIEKQAAHSQFIDLCRLLEEPTPHDPDNYCFEKDVAKLSGGRGWADVWKRNHFAWEYKSPGLDLEKAYAQLQQYAVALENPPLLIVSDLQEFRIHTNWTNTVQESHSFHVEQLLEDSKRQILKWAFSDTEQLRPGQTREELTASAASAFADLARRLRARGHDPQAVAHFVNRLIFCMFAESANLLQRGLFTELLNVSSETPHHFPKFASTLFSAMRDGGHVGFSPVPWFNGGLFDDDAALPLELADIRLVIETAKLSWKDIDPSIFGTLFERGLDPDKRSQLGAHYTDRDKIKRIIDPVIAEPLTKEWEDAKSQAQILLKKAKESKSLSVQTKAKNEAEAICIRYLERLKNFRVLDPACGSGNFLYMSLEVLKNLEHQVSLQMDEMGFGRPLPAVGPEALLGIEINPYATELARVSVWIGEIQWMLGHGYGTSRNPILRSLNNIECRDALLNSDGTEAVWPKAEAIVGNPPFLGDRKIIPVLGADGAHCLRARYDGRVPRGADLVCYWFEKAFDQISSGHARRAGLVATNSIRGGTNRSVLEKGSAKATIFNAWADEAWVVDGASVRVSLICFCRPSDAAQPVLNGSRATAIYADLTSGSADVTSAVKLRTNAGVSFQGTISYGPFEITGDEARCLLLLPSNPNGRSNADVVRPRKNGLDITRRPSDHWLIFFPDGISERDAAFYQKPFALAKERVRPFRAKRDNDELNKKWWTLWRSRPEMFAKLEPLKRYVITPAVAKHRTFSWVDSTVVPDHAVICFARDDDTAFGVLHSRFHELWSLRLGTSLEDRPRYTPTTSFETFPFPASLEPNVPAASYADDPRAQAIAEAARKLVEARDRWLNPPELVDIVPEVVPGYPDRLVPRDARAAATLKTRTLTNLYNTRGKPEGAWLDHLHRDLDVAVAAAYGWPTDLADDDVLDSLLTLNVERARTQ